LGADPSILGVSPCIEPGGIVPVWGGSIVPPQGLIEPVGGGCIVPV